MNKKDIVKHFDKLAEFTEPMIDRGDWRASQWVVWLKVTDKNGKPMSGVKVSAKLNRHEFKFGCAIFLLDQFPDERINTLYREEFRKLFNYAVMPLYWDTLEPKEGKPRFNTDSENIYRRPALDLIKNIVMKTVYASKGIA